VRIESEKGVALITALLVLFLVSTLVIGLSWMVMTDQRLGGNYSAHESAFYGAEAGMEKMTADVGTKFTTNGFLTTNQHHHDPVHSSFASRYHLYERGESLDLLDYLQRLPQRGERHDSAAQPVLWVAGADQYVQSVGGCTNRIRIGSGTKAPTANGVHPRFSVRHFLQR
jgi:hypothetical protein